MPPPAQENRSDRLAARDLAAIAYQSETGNRLIPSARSQVPHRNRGRQTPPPTAAPIGLGETLFGERGFDYGGPVIALLAMIAADAAAPTGVVQVEVGNVRGAQGKVHVEICTQPQFLKDCPRSGDAPARIGTTVVTIAGLPPGRYAAQVFYDENGNGKVDRALFGVPKEGVGFSNDAKIRLGPPKWDEARFDYDGRSRTIRVRLRYFIGPDAPAPAR